MSGVSKRLESLDVLRGFDMFFIFLPDPLASGEYLFGTISKGKAASIHSWLDLPDGEYKVKVKLYNKKSNLYSIPFSITAFAGKDVKTELFNFENAAKGAVIDIATLTFKNGKVVTPIEFH